MKKGLTEEQAKEYLRRRQKNTYAARSKEGRTQHGQTSYGSILVGSLAWFLQAIALFTPYWRSGVVNMLGYAGRRSWGLFQVSGRLSQTHYTIFTNTCAYWGQLTVGGGCYSPICQWYQLKCSTYGKIMITSYVGAFVFALAFVIHTLALVWTVQLTTRKIRWAATWWPASLVLQVAVIVTWIMITEDELGALNAQSYYPMPQISFSSITAMVAACFTLINCVLASLLKTMWPEIDLDEEESEVEESSDDEDEEEKEDTKARKGKAKAKAASRPDYGPPAGAGLDPFAPYAQQQGYEGPPPGFPAPQQPLLPMGPPMPQNFSSQVPFVQAPLQPSDYGAGAAPSFSGAPAPVEPLDLSSQGWGFDTSQAQPVDAPAPTPMLRRDNTITMPQLPS